MTLSFYTIISKENVVRLVFAFDKNSKMTDFSFSPVMLEEKK